MPENSVAQDAAAAELYAHTARHIDLRNKINLSV